MAQESRRRRYEEVAARRHRHQEHLRHLQDLRFDAYVAMITAANRVYAAVKHPAEGEVNPVTVRATYESLLLAVSPAFMVAADKSSRDVIAALVRASRQLTQAALGETGVGDDIDNGTDDGGEPPSLDALLRAHRRCVRRAEAVMRVELGIGDREPSPPVTPPVP